jgi:hypothetical protein
MHIATRMAEQLELPNDEIKTIRYASLLHDIGHGPFSHAFEGVLSSVNEPEKVTHEDITRQIIKTNGKIREILGDKIDDILSLFANATVSREIISGNIDADRLDYLRRDSYYTGVAYGEFDIERILHTIHKKTDGNRSFLTVLEKGMDAIESFRLARFLMYSQVYNHHTRLICDSMLQRAVEIAFRDGIIEKDKFRLSNPDFLENYLILDDYRLINQLLSDKKSNSYKIANDLENRCLLKRGYELDVTQHTDAILKIKITRLNPTTIKQLENDLANVCGCSSDLIIVYKNTIKNSLFGSRIEENKSPILIEKKSDEIQEIETISSLFNSWRPPTKFFVFCPEEYKQIIQRHTEEIIRSIPT